MPVKWRKVWIADENYESAGVFDVNNDGVLDIVSGAWWYQGPDFKKKQYIGEVKAYGEYYDDFSTIPMDVNGDGYMDFITGGWWGNTLRWRENPGANGGQWPEHVIAETGNVETTRGWDVDRDGRVEIIPNTPCSRDVKVFKLKTNAKGNGTGQFTTHTMFTFPEGQFHGHGLGCGDIAGNGRMDIVLNKGWLEAPKEPFKGRWKWHPDFDLGCGSVPILIVDVNRDGVNDLIVGQAHSYGLDWWGQKVEGDKRVWKKHPIDPYNSQYHDMMWLDIDGDGECELVTGKRYRAHCDNDPGAHDNVGIYYFKWTGECFSKQVIDWGPARVATGCGIHFVVADLTGNGLPDIVAPGKDGLYVFYNEGRQ